MRHAPIAVLSLVLVVLPLVLMATPGAAEGQEEAAQARGLAALDTLRMHNVGSPRISPDGAWILYTVSARDMDDEDFERRGHIWRVGVNGEANRQLTHGSNTGAAPRWFPGGDRFAFTRSVDDKNQVFVMYTDGGEAWQITEHAEGVQTYAISPDGTKILFTSRDPETDEQKRRKRQRDDAVVVDAEFRWTHLWMHDLDSGETKRLSEGEFTVSDPRWSPGSDQIAFVTRPNTKADDGWNSDIRVVDAGSGESRLLFENPGPDSSPRWSPDGSTIAFTANRFRVASERPPSRVSSSRVAE